MPHIAFISRILLIVLGLGTLETGVSVAANTAMASLNQTGGSVEVIQAQDQKRIKGRDGLLLYATDTVKTGDNGHTTILFRDGSEVRLFENTEFVIEEAAELETQERSFNYKFLMKLGSMWGKFVRGRQKTKIQSSNATIGVKGTVLRLKDSEESATIAVAEGALAVENGTSSVILESGKRLAAFTNEDQLEDKLEDIPYRLVMAPEKFHMDFRNSNEETVRIGIQMIDIMKGSNIKKPGRVYLQSNYYNTFFPNSVALDSSGFTRIPVVIRSPNLDDDTFDGKVIIWAVMDDPTYDDVGDGSIMLTIKMPGKRKYMRVDADSGTIIPVE